MIKTKSRGGRREGAGRKPQDPAHPINEVFAFAVTANEREFLREKGGAWVRKLIRKQMSKN